MHESLRTPGTRGFLLYVKERMPWLYAEYVQRGAAAVVAPGVGADDGGYMGALDVSYDVGGTTTYFGDDYRTPPFVGERTADPAATAPTSATTPAQAGWLSQVAQAAGTYLLAKDQAKTQQKILDVQLRQAQLGLPMLNLSQLERSLPHPQVNVGLSPDTTRTALMIAGVVAGGLLLMSLVNRAGRSGARA